MHAAEPWVDLRTLVCVQTTRWQHGQATHATRYYLSSLALASAPELTGYVRGHWGIENHQHWHLDVTWAEDACRCRRDHIPRNLSTLRKLTLSLLQTRRDAHEPASQAQEDRPRRWFFVASASPTQPPTRNRSALTTHLVQ